MNRLVYLVMAFLNPFGKLYVITAAQHKGVEAQSLSWLLPAAASTPSKCTALQRSSAPLLPPQHGAATFISRLCCSALEPAFHTCNLQF